MKPNDSSRVTSTAVGGTSVKVQAANPGVATVKSLLKQVVPPFLIAAIRRHRSIPPADDRPLADIFTDVYKQQAWGGAASFDSGEGSSDPRMTVPYIEAVGRWCREIGAEKLTVVDLGCGDMQVGQMLMPFFQSYVGADVVPSLVDRNRELFAGSSFVVCDITQDELPDGDVAVVRQVLQHLSNEQIGAVLRKLDKYRYVIVSEAQPEGRFRANVDIPPGAHHRVRVASGVVLTEPPFSLPKGSLRLLAQSSFGRNTYRLSTWVYDPQYSKAS